MEGISINAVLKKNRSGDNFGYLKIRIIQNGKTTDIPLGMKLKERFWNKNAHVVRKICDNYLDLNDLINEKLAEVKATYNLSENKVQKVVTNNKKSFLSYLLDEILNLEKLKKWGTATRRRTLLYHLKAYMLTKGQDDLLFSQITPLFVRDFETYLSSLDSIDAINSVKVYMVVFRTVFNNAVGLREYIIPDGMNVFFNFKNEQTKPIGYYLTKDEVNKIMTFPFEKEHSLYNTRNYFIFQIFSGGLRVSDLLTLRWNTIDTIVNCLEISQYKTKNSHTVPVNVIMLSILKDYIYDDKVVEQIEDLFKKEYDIASDDFKTPMQKHLENAENIVMKIGGIENKEPKKSLKLTYEQLFIEYLKVKDNSNYPTIHEQYNKIRADIFKEMRNLIYGYAKKHSKEFIFPMLKNERFSDVTFDKNTTLTKYQNNQLQSQTTMYNRSLKLLQSEIFGESYFTGKREDLKFISHLPRHVIAYLMVSKKSDVFDVSITLGHSRVTVTENYIERFAHKDRLEDANNSQVRDFIDYVKIPSK